MFNIIIKDDFLYGLGNVTNTFFIDVGDFVFPGNDWVDFSVTVLGWWLEEILSANNCKNKKFELWFMDGPCRIECVKDDDWVYMQFIFDRSTMSTAIKDVIGSMTVLYDKLLKIVYRSAKKLISFIEKQNFADELKDLSILKTMVDKTNAVLKSSENR